VAPSFTVGGSGTTSYSSDKTQYPIFEGANCVMRACAALLHAHIGLTTRRGDVPYRCVCACAVCSLCTCASVLTHHYHICLRLVSSASLLLYCLTTPPLLPVSHTTAVATATATTLAAISSADTINTAYLHPLVLTLLSLLSPYYYYL
jgi:hypothetical protein